MTQIKQDFHRFLFLSVKICLICVICVLTFPSCGKKNENILKGFQVTDTIPLLNTTNVSTLISDSGVTRYRIEADRWLIYQSNNETFWDFPEGLHVERFDRALNTDANIQSDRAVYFDSQK
ncbi:MAG: hypothetical protein LBR75_00835, partial [Prevotellaceae bacterium]|nr:hypothetical protein [Prevotellaceae bacterium]